jgi:regulator of protease activity HflC (stomatin/prohibitin superfamily)
MGTLLGVVFGLVLSTPFWPYILAHFDLFFTFVKEGEAKIVVAGESYVRTILSLSGFIVSTDGSIVPGFPQKSLFERWFGIYWVGIAPFRKVYAYTLRWMSYQPKAGNSGDKEPVVKTAVLDSTFVKDKVYYGQANAVETSEGLPLDIEFLVTLRVVNPRMALFLISNWVEAVIDRTTQQARVYVGKKTYKALLQRETSHPDKGFSGYMANALAKTIRDDYGVEFVSCDILSIEPPEQYREATTKAYTAEQNAVAITTEATALATAITVKGNAEAGVITAKGTAEAESLTKRIKAFKKAPDAAQALLTAEVGKAQGVGMIAEAIGKGLRGGNV